MATKQGKIRAIPLPIIGSKGKPLPKDLQVYNARSKRIGKIDYHVDNGNYKIILSGTEVCFMYEWDMKQLVVECKESSYQTRVDYGPSVLTASIKQYPLKWSQWQSAIDNGEVDTDKVVNFEVIDKPAAIRGEHNGYYAKIIPARFSKTSLSTEDANHLGWIYQRLIHVHGENPNLDYMLKLKEIINRF